MSLTRRMVMALFIGSAMIFTTVIMMPFLEQVFGVTNCPWWEEPIFGDFFASRVMVITAGRFAVPDGQLFEPGTTR